MRGFLLILSMLCGANAFAGLNKWVDADGKVHYSDQPPPPNARVQTLRIPSEVAAPESVPDAPKTVAEREAELRKARQAKQEDADKAAREQEAGKASCAAAQQDLRLLQEGMRLMDVDAKGERYYLDDEQRRQRIEKARQDIGTFCK